MAPSSGTSINVGQGALAGAAALGIGALAFYGAGLSGEMGAVEKSVMWPQYVKDRIRDTYMSVSLAQSSVLITNHQFSGISEPQLPPLLGPRWQPSGPRQ